MPPTIVLLPGLDGTGQLFADFVAALGASAEVIVARYPTDTPLAYAELEPIARSFLPADRPYFLLAESFSGPIAVTIAASNPANLQGLILSCSFAHNPRPLLSLIRPFLGVVPVTALPTALLSFFVLGRFASPTLRAALIKALASVVPSVLRTRIRAALSADVSALVSRIQVPMLYLRAREDRIVPEASCRLLLSLAPGMQVIAFEAPHFLLQVLPSQTAAATLEFMDHHHRA